MRKTSDYVLEILSRVRFHADDKILSLEQGIPARRLALLLELFEPDGLPH